MEDDQLIYNGNFSDEDIAETWQTRNGICRWGWHYHNNGGRDEDIFFRFDRIKPDETESGKLEEEPKVRITPYIISPSIHLSE